MPPKASPRGHAVPKETAAAPGGPLASGSRVPKNVQARRLVAHVEQAVVLEDAPDVGLRDRGVGAGLGGHVPADGLGLAQVLAVARVDDPDARVVVRQGDLAVPGVEVVRAEVEGGDAELPL